MTMQDKATNVIILDPNKQVTVARRDWSSANKKCMFVYMKDKFPLDVIISYDDMLRVIAAIERMKPMVAGSISVQIKPTSEIVICPKAMPGTQIVMHQKQATAFVSSAYALLPLRVPSPSCWKCSEDAERGVAHVCGWKLGAHQINVKAIEPHAHPWVWVDRELEYEPRITTMRIGDGKMWAWVASSGDWAINYDGKTAMRGTRADFSEVMEKFNTLNKCFTVMKGKL